MRRRAPPRQECRTGRLPSWPAGQSRRLLVRPAGQTRQLRRQSRRRQTASRPAGWRLRRTLAPPQGRHCCQTGLRRRRPEPSWPLELQQACRQTRRPAPSSLAAQSPPHRQMQGQPTPRAGFAQNLFQKCGQNQDWRRSRQAQNLQHQGHAGWQNPHRHCGSIMTAGDANLQTHRMPEQMLRQMLGRKMRQKPARTRRPRKPAWRWIRTSRQKTSRTRAWMQRLHARTCSAHCSCCITWQGTLVDVSASHLDAR